MNTNIYNPWHGCHKYSAGCLNCYVYRRDQSIGKDASIVEKTSSFDLPIRKNKKGQYICTEKLLYCCMTSDFFLEEADQWRKEIWSMIHQRQDIHFMIITKRIHRFHVSLPEDWGEGYDNVTICCTMENQREVEHRLEYFLSLPIRHKQIINEPCLSDITFPVSISSIEQVTVGGESGEHARPLDYQWVLHIRQQCIENDVPFRFKQTGANFKKDGKSYSIARKNQLTQASKANIDYKCR